MNWRTLASLSPLLLLALACERPRSAGSFHEGHSFPTTEGKLVRIEARSLDVEVSVVPSSSIEVSVELEARSSSRVQANRWVERHKPTFDDSDAKLEINVPRRAGVTFQVGWFSSQGKIAVSLPPSCRLEVVTSSGDITLDGQQALSGPVRVDTSSGEIKVRGGASELLAHSSSGDIEIRDAALDLLDADTSSGAVELHSSAKRALVETSSGSVRLQGLTGEISVRTTSGDVHATWESAEGSFPARVRTHSGEVWLAFPGSTAPTGQVRTSTGHIRSRFEGSWDHRRRQLELFPGASGVHLDVQTTSGAVTLSSSL